MNIHRGLFQYNRLPPGVNSVPGVFHRIIDNMVAGKPEVKPYLDDIVIVGFTLSLIEFLGHIMDKDG